MMKMQKSNSSVISLAIVAAALFVACILMAALLAACGDEATPVPASNAPASNTQAAGTQAANPGSSNFFVINGATTTSVPATLKAALAQYEAQYPGSKAQAFKTGAASAQVKEQLAGAFGKEGWQNITPSVPDTAGGFALAFTKNNKGAAVVGFPGIMANLGQNENLYIVFLPN